MAKPMQSVDPTLLALQVANTATQNAKKKVLPSLTTQAPIQSSLNAPKQQTQAISTNITPPTAKIGGISSPFGATNINSSPVLGGATPQEIGTVSKQLQSLPKAMPETGTSTEVNRDETLGQLIGNIDQGDDFQTIQTKYPELKGLDEESLGQLVGNIDQGDSVDVILQKFPELQGGQKDNFITNLGSGIAGTAAATGQLGKNLAFKAVDLYRTKVQGKEKLTPEQRAMAEQSDMGQNLSSITNRQTEAQKKSIGGQIGTAVGTLGQAFAMPTGVGSLSKIPAVAKIAQKAPIISSMIKGGLQGVVGQDQYTLMTEGRQSTAEERSIAGGIGLAFPLLGAIIKATKPFVQKGIKSAVNTLQTSGIINPAKFDQIKSQLIAEGVEGMEKATVDDVANFLTERGIKGTRQQQADILEEVANKSRLAKKEVLDLSTNLHAPDSAKVLAQTLVDELGTAKSQATKAIANKAQQLLNKLDNGGATLNEIDDLRAMGRKELNTRTSAGNVKISQQDVDNLIGEVRGYIEDAAQKEGLPQLVGYQGEKNLIKMLNNQTSTAKGLAEGILRRDSTDAVQQLMTFMSARGGGVIAGGLAGSQGGMFDNNTTAGKIGNIAVGAFLGGIVDNPKIKSNVAQYLNKLTGTQKGAILKRMESGGKELLEREDKDVINGLKNIIMNNNKEIPNSLPYKPNANITTNDITTSAMGNSNKVGVILSEGGIVPPKPTPKTPPITVEKGAIGMGTPKPKVTPVIPPKATVAPSVSAPKKGMPKLGKEIMEQNLYHGTRYNFDTFDIKKSYSDRNNTLGAGDAIYFSESKDIADKYTRANANEYLHKSVIDEVKDTNAKKLLKGLVDNGFDKGWGSMTRDEIKAMNAKGIDGNDINDLSEWIRGSQSVKKEGTNLLTMNNKLEMPDSILKIAKKLGINTIPGKPKVMSISLKENARIKNIGQTNNIQKATMQAKKEGYDGAKFITNDSIGGKPEIAVWNTSVIKKPLPPLPKKGLPKLGKEIMEQDMPIEKKDGITLYHGTNKQFDKFILDKVSNGRVYGDGVYLTNSFDDAKLYAKTSTNDFGGERNIIEASIKKTLKLADEDTYRKYKRNTNKLKKDGYQGLVIPTGILNRDRHFVIFDPDNVKVIKNTLFSTFGPLIGGGLLYTMLQGDENKTT